MKSWASVLLQPKNMYSHVKAGKSKEKPAPRHFGRALAQSKPCFFLNFQPVQLQENKFLLTKQLSVLYRMYLYFTGKNI